MKIGIILTCFICGVTAVFDDRIQNAIVDFDLNAIFKEFSPVFSGFLSSRREKRGIERSELSRSLASDSYSDYALESSANTSSFGKNSSLDCINIVLDDLHTNLKQIFPKLNDTFNIIFKLKPENLNDASSNRWFSLFNLKSFEKFCSYYNGSRKHLDSCPNSYIKDLALDTLAIVDFMCLKRYDDVVTYFPCLQKNDENIYKPCEKSCSSFVAQETPNVNTSNVNSTADISKVFKSDCKYITCLIQCEGPIVEAKCKTSAKNLVTDAVKVIFASLQEIIVNKLKFDWPKSCQDLVNIKI